MATHKMTEAMWRRIGNFSPEEKWGDPYQMDSRLIFELETFRNFVGRQVIIHCGYEKRAWGGQHPLGTAADLHVVNMPLLEQFIAACRFNFIGIGIYPLWNSPGLHLDMRINVPHRQLWGCVGKKAYTPINEKFIRAAINNNITTVYKNRATEEAVFKNAFRKKT